jgi:hypothetical protein
MFSVPFAILVPLVDFSVAFYTNARQVCQLDIRKGELVRYSDNMRG